MEIPGDALLLILVVEEVLVFVVELRVLPEAARRFCMNASNSAILDICSDSVSLEGSDVSIAPTVSGLADDPSGSECGTENLAVLISDVLRLRSEFIPGDDTEDCAAPIIEALAFTSEFIPGKDKGDFTVPASEAPELRSALFPGDGAVDLAIPVLEALKFSSEFSTRDFAAPDTEALELRYLFLPGETVMRL